KFIHTWLRFGEIMRGSLSAQYLDKRREMMQWWADWLDGKVE
ncbi:hypothetical protein, partial [Escherichia coli]